MLLRAVGGQLLVHSGNNCVFLLGYKVVYILPALLQSSCSQTGEQVRMVSLVV